jgi:hypothetical protein
VESTQRVAQSIGPAGGTVATTSLAGLAYRPDIPAGALTTPTEIAITPVRSIADLPYSGGLESLHQHPARPFVVDPGFSLKSQRTRTRLRSDASGSL